MRDYKKTDFYLRPYHYINILFLIALTAVDVMYFWSRVTWGAIALVFFLYLVVLVLGSIFIRWNFYMVSRHKGADKKLIALTFDDGPASETEAILDILKKNEVSGAFFVIGKNAAAYPEVLKRIDAEGHLIGNHSYDHGFNFDWQRKSKMSEEMVRTNVIVKKVTGKTPLLFRPPYGVTNPSLSKAIRETGMTSIGWSIRSFDTKAKTPEELLSRVLEKLSGGDIILFHDSMAATRDILTELIAKAREKGFTFARVDQLLEIDAYL